MFISIMLLLSPKSIVLLFTKLQEQYGLDTFQDTLSEMYICMFSCQVAVKVWKTH